MCGFFPWGSSPVGLAEGTGQGLEPVVVHVCVSVCMRVHMSVHVGVEGGREDTTVSEAAGSGGTGSGLLCEGH